MKQLKILMVDDDVDDRAITEEALQTVNPGVILQFADNGAEALKLMNTLFDASILPSLIVLDVNMPKMSGPEVLSVLKNDTRYSTIPVVIYSTSINPYEREKCITLGAHSYITKPVSLKESLETAKTFLNICDLSTATNSLK